MHYALKNMNILFLTLSRIEDINARGIYTDLMRVLIDQGNNVFIASPTERRFGKKTHVIKGDNYEILKIKTLNIQKTNVVEKGIGTLLLESQFNKAISRQWGNKKFDLVLYSTPPITFNKVIKKIKSRFGAKSYLLLKDIFPQNAVDLGMFSKSSPLYKLFRRKEKVLYEISDRIGCMSPANVEYVLRHNPEFSKNKVEVFPNSMIPLPYKPATDIEREDLKLSLGIDPKKVLSLYGGNLGKPQGIDYLIEVIKENENHENHHILIIGNGTEYGKLNRWFKENKPKNSTLKARLPKAEYDQLARCADIGLIFLDHRFTIPNYPSRLLSYLENGIPVMAATDPNTDIGSIAEAEGYGVWCESNDVNSFFEKIEPLISNSELRKKMGEKGRRYFEEIGLGSASLVERFF